MGNVCLSQDMLQRSDYTKTASNYVPFKGQDAVSLRKKSS